MRIINDSELLLYSRRLSLLTTLLSHANLVCVVCGRGRGHGRVYVCMCACECAYECVPVCYVCAYVCICMCLCGRSHPCCGHGMSSSCPSVMWVPPASQTALTLLVSTSRGGQPGASSERQALMTFCVPTAFTLCSRAASSLSRIT